MVTSSEQVAELINDHLFNVKLLASQAYDLANEHGITRGELRAFERVGDRATDLANAIIMLRQYVN